MQYKHSAWERLTNGLCNADLPDTARPAHTARQIKNVARRQQKKARLKFDKASALTIENTVESRREWSKMSETWYNRGTGTLRGFYNPKVARKIKREGIAA